MTKQKNKIKGGEKMQNVSKNGIWVFLDNEGPCTLNDNAQETTVALARRCGLGGEVGVNFYKNISNIDDIWGDFHQIPEDPSYSSGHTLKIVLPFFKAMGADSQWLYNFAKNNIRVVPNIKKVLANLDGKYNVWQVSTSYEFFIRAFCNLVGFDFERARCTFVREFDKIPLAGREGDILKNFMKEVAEMPPIEYNPETGKVIEKHQKFYNDITNFIWEIVYRNMPVGELLRIVHPVGQTQKMEAVRNILQKAEVPEVPLRKTIYVGDSQTDIQAIRLLQNVGLTMMFNGKGKVCSLANLMYIGENAGAIQEVVDRFAELGREGVIDYYTPLREAEHGGLLAAVTPNNVEELEKKSVEKRKEFRGVRIGELT